MNPILQIEGLDVHYGRAHALQQVSLTLERGVRAVVGRNGMGKTTLCNAVTGLLPAAATAAGSVRLAGEEILGLAPNLVTGKGIGYVPQGRRVWPSLSVDEHLRLAARSRKGAWTVQRIYASFPRLAERKANGGAELSGGEQQMLAIGRALLLNPKLLVMDEPTEGLAPVIVQQVAGMLKSLAADGEIAVLLIEQNLGVAIDIADAVDVVVNGRIARSMSAAELAADRELQQRLLGVRAGGEEEIAPAPAAQETQEVRVYTVKRASESVVQEEERAVRGFTRWGGSALDRPVGAAAAQTPPRGQAPPPEDAPQPAARVVEFPVAQTFERAAYVAGTFDTKGRELAFLRNCLDKLGMRTVTVDLATSGKPSSAMVHPREVARHHPKGEAAVFTGDRGTAVTEMAVAFEHFVARRRDLGGLISAGGSGGTALATRAMRRLPIGVPKVMVSTVASGDVRPYVGPADICMMYSVTDVSGINRISERVLANAAHALAGMIAHARPADSKSDSKPAIGLTMFGLTTACVQAVTRQLEAQHDCIVFHATGTGGQSMEKLVESNLLAAVIDVTTTEIADEIAGGVLSAGAERMDVFARVRVPYVGSCGALDMVNFWAPDTVPERYRGRTLYRHNPNVTLMRTTAAECASIGRFIADKLNRMQGPVRFLLPEGGLSGLDAPDRPFWDPAADKALFDAIAANFRSATDRRLLRLPHHVNDQAFADALVAAFHEIASHRETGRMARIARQDILKKLRAMVRSGQPIIGGGAGTGLSAKCEEAGGIDLIVIYNSGRYRMAGRGSLAGLLAYGNANDIVLDMAREVLPVVKHTPVLAGVNGTDPFLVREDFLRRLAALGFSGVQNFPTVGLFDGVIRRQLEETGMGYGLEVDMIRAAAGLDLLTTPYVFSEDNARDMARAGADIIVCHLGLTTGGAIGAETALRLADCVPLIEAWTRAARKVNKDVIVLCHGGPIATPKDAQFILKSCPGCNGFYGASSMERLPVEVALTGTTRRFKSIKGRRAS